MADNLRTIWEAEPHTLAKHGILKTYLEAWAAILGRSHLGPELLFVDGFAGPGQYLRGEPGSPIVALNSILEHDRTFLKNVRLIFIELDKERHAHLTIRLEQESARIASHPHVVVEPPILGNCETEIRKLIAYRRKHQKPLGPALFFLDQFGYSKVPMSLVRAVMAEPTCEVFSYLNGQRMNAYLADRTKWAGITEAYGDESWMPALKMNGPERQEFLINTYKDAIRKYANINYVWSFAMFDSGGHLIHWLVFATNHWNGLFEMKRAMWKADGTGRYQFSDRVAGVGQQSFLSMLDDDQLGKELTHRLSGQTLSEPQVRDFVLTKTPFYNYKSHVNKLRTATLAVPRSPGQWPVTFLPDRNTSGVTRHKPSQPDQRRLW